MFKRLSDKVGRFCDKVGTSAGADRPMSRLAALVALVTYPGIILGTFTGAHAVTGTSLGSILAMTAVFTGGVGVVGVLTAYCAERLRLMLKASHRRFG